MNTPLFKSVFNNLLVNINKVVLVDYNSGENKLKIIYDTPGLNTISSNVSEYDFKQIAKLFKCRYVMQEIKSEPRPENIESDEGCQQTDDTTPVGIDK